MESPHQGTAGGTLKGQGGAGRRAEGGGGGMWWRLESREEGLWEARGAEEGGGRLEKGGGVPRVEEGLVGRLLEGGWGGGGGAGAGAG